MLQQDSVGATRQHCSSMLTCVRKASGVRLAASSGVPAATFRMAAVKTSGLGITCNVHLHMQPHVTHLTAVHLLSVSSLTQNIVVCGPFKSGCCVGVAGHCRCCVSGHAGWIEQFPAATIAWQQARSAPYCVCLHFTAENGVQYICCPIYMLSNIHSVQYRPYNTSAIANHDKLRTNSCGDLYLSVHRAR